MKEVINEIQRQTGYNIIISSQLLKLASPVSVNFKNVSLKEALDKCFSGQPFDYVINKKTIIISEKKTAENSKIPKAIQISGKVTDEKGQPLPGVSIRIKNLQMSTVSDIQGNYKLNVPDQNAILVFSFIGFTSQEIPATKTTVNVVMKEHLSTLDEIVVIGYGEVRKRDLTGAVGQVSIEDMQKAPVKSFDESLAGRVAGVQVTSSDGQPGSNSNIVIRGSNSVTQDNSPLYVVDGFPLESPDINGINQSDIASIDILKDASSTAIYGARGANGVIIITTKKGKKGAPKLNYTNYIGFQEVPKVMDVMSPYDFVKYQIDFNTSGGAVASTDAEKMYLDGRGLDYYANISGINYQDLAFQTASMQNHDISLRGGTDKTLYAISGNLFRQDGVIINSSFGRNQGRVIIDQTITNKLKAGVNANYSNSRSLGTRIATSNQLGSANVMYQLWGYRPVAGVDDSNLLDDLVDPGQASSEIQLVNPIISLKNTYEASISNSLIANAYAEYRLNKDLTLKVTGGITSISLKDESFYNSLTSRGNPRNPNGVNGFVYSTTNDTWLNENTLTYKTTRGKHNLNLLGGITAQGYKHSRSGFSATQIPNEILGVSGMDESPSQTGSSVTSNWKLASFLSRVNYNYNSTYLLTASFRADGSSKFVKGKRWGYFPSGSVAWRMGNEPFIKDLGFISDAKLRLSYGITGNNRITEFSYLTQLNFINSSAYSYNNQIPQRGLGLATFGNPDLKWESTEQLDIGYDLSLFRDRVSATVDVYRKITRDLLLNAQLPYSMGLGAAFKNVGKMKNEGLEISINTRNVQTKEFNWNTSFNISFNKNEVLGLTENQTALQSKAAFTDSYNNLFPYIAVVGQPVAQMYGLVWDGVYQYSDFDKLPDGNFVLKSHLPITNGKTKTTIKPGDIKYKDLNGDLVTDGKDYTVIGRALPLHTGGLNNNFRYKAFDLNVFFQWSYGNDILNANRLIFEGNGRGIYNLNQYETYVNRWTPDNPSNTLFRAGGQGPAFFSSRVIEDGSFLRFKTISAGYNLQANSLKHLKINALRIYMSVQNLVTWTSYSGMDPEVSVRSSTPLTPGFDYSAYPRARTFTFGLNLTL